MPWTRRIDSQLKLLLCLLLLTASSTALCGWMLLQYHHLAVLLGDTPGLSSLFAPSAAPWGQEASLVAKLATAGIAANLLLAFLLGRQLRRALARRVEGVATAIGRVANGDLTGAAVSPGAAPADAVADPVEASLRDLHHKLSGAVVRLRSGAEGIGEIAAELSQRGPARALHAAAEFDGAEQLASELAAAAEHLVAQTRQASASMLRATQAAALDLSGHSSAQALRAQSDRQAEDIVGGVSALAYRLSQVALDADPNGAATPYAQCQAALQLAQLRTAAQDCASLADSLNGWMQERSRDDGPCRLHDAEAEAAREACWDHLQRASHAVHALVQQSEAHQQQVLACTQLISPMQASLARNAVLIDQCATGSAAIRDQVAGMNRVLGSFVLGTEDGQRAQIHLVASNPHRLARLGRERGQRPRIAAVPSLDDAAATPADMSWQTF